MPTAEEAPQKYSYNCTDRSILLPWVKRYVSLYYRWTPARLTANMITLLASSMMWILLALCCLLPSTADPTLVGALFALLLHNYVVGDHLDGMRARRTGTSSPLGEFLDHYLDIYNGAITVHAFFFVLGMPMPMAFTVTMWFFFAAYAATMVEGKERGEIHFGVVGTLEGLVLTVVFFATWTIPAVRAFWLGSGLFGLPTYTLTLGLGLGFAGTALRIIVRLGRIPRPMLLFLVGCLGAVACVSGPLGQQGMFFLVLLYGGDYIGRVMGSTFLGGSHPNPDLPATAALILLPVAERLLRPVQWAGLAMSAGVLLYLAVRLLHGVSGVLRDLRRYCR